MSMVLATVDRIEDEVMVLVTHTDPALEINLPRVLFLGFVEGDVVRLIMERDGEGKEEMEKEIEDIRIGLNITSLGEQ